MIADARDKRELAWDGLFRLYQRAKLHWALSDRGHAKNHER